MADCSLLRDRGVADISMAREGLMLFAFEMRGIVAGTVRASLWTMPVRHEDIDERVFRFACDVVEYVRTVRWEPGSNKIIEQLVAAAGSTGANRHEATAGSPKEFIRFNTIALREARESHFWLRLCAAKKLGSVGLCVPLVNEADQIKRILGAIVVRRKASLREELRRKREGDRRR
jgi:four helix bundle protein